MSDYKEFKDRSGLGAVVIITVALCLTGLGLKIVECSNSSDLMFLGVALCLGFSMMLLFIIWGVSSLLEQGKSFWHKLKVRR